MFDLIDKLKSFTNEIPNKKIYLELITATLTIPVLITVLFVNISNIKKVSEQKQNIISSEVSPTSKKQEIIDKPTPKEEATPMITPIPPSTTILYITNAQCKKEIGPVEILSPKENEVIKENHLCLDISYQQSEFCLVVWSYKIDNNPWSEYTDKSICLYGLASGEKNLELKVKSVVSTNELILKRNFTVLLPTVTLISTPQQSTTSGKLESN